MRIKKIARKLMAFLHGLIPHYIYARLLESEIKCPCVSVSTTSFGKLCGITDDYIYKQAITHGTNEPHFIELAMLLLKSDSVAIDVGANIGTHTLIMSNILTSGHVYSFEPQSLIFSILQNNVLMNRRENISAYRFAVTYRNNDVLTMQPLKLGLSKNNTGITQLNTNSSISGDYVLTRSLDSFCFTKVDFIKIDVQGAELFVLNGAKNLITEFRPYLFVEIEEQHLRAMRSSSRELIERILDFGYIVYRVETDYPCDHICIPLERAAYFDAYIKNCLSFTLSKKIAGKKVNVVFSSDKDNNYSEVIILE